MSCDCKKGVDYIGVGCGALIVNDKNEVLLMERGVKAKNEVGFWAQPGGTVEFGETIQSAIKREIKEELNIDIELFELLSVTDHIIKDENQHWVAAAYRAKIVSGKPENMEPEKISNIKWFPLEQLPEKLSLTTLNSADSLKKILQKNKGV
jgi:ADP-ribose pyrophosphatase